MNKNVVWSQEALNMSNNKTAAFCAQQSEIIANARNRFHNVRPQDAVFSGINVTKT